MTHSGNRRRVLFFVLLFAWILPCLASAQEAFIKEVDVKTGEDGWRVSFHVTNCFTEGMEEAIRSGIKTVFTFSIDCFRKRWWRDRKLASLQFRHAILYDPIRREYQVTLEENGSILGTTSFEEAKKWMANIEAVEVRPADPLTSGSRAELRIRAELDPVKLPFPLEYLFFFTSLWDFKTKWYVKPLSGE